MDTLEEIRQFQIIAKEAISIYNQRIAFYSDILNKLQDAINRFDGGESK